MKEEGSAPGLGLSPAWEPLTATVVSSYLRQLESVDDFIIFVHVNKEAGTSQPHKGLEVK